MSTTNRTKGLTAKGVPPQARWLLYVKIAILALSLIVLALAAYAISLFGSYYGLIGGTGSGGYLIFVTIKTFIVMGGATAIEIWFPHVFYRIIALVAYILSIIFWLSAWAWAASTAGLWLSTSCYFGTCGRSSYASREGGALAACAGIGAIIWILSIVNLVFFVKACLADPEGVKRLDQAELGQVKHEATPTNYPAEQHNPQTTYPTHD